MVHDQPDVIEGPERIDAVAVRFDEQRLVSDAGLLLSASLAERLGIEGAGERQRVAGSEGSGCGAGGA